MIRGWVNSEEFVNAVLIPLETGQPLPHEEVPGGPDAARIEWLLRHLALDGTGYASIRDAASWRDLLHVLVGLPGFPRPHAASGAPTQSMSIEAAVDRVLLLPRFGCFIEGWVLSPLLRVRSFRLRVGGVVMALQPNTLTWKPRRDLEAAYPDSEAMAAAAGFIGLFECDQEPVDYAEAVLQILFEEGASASSIVPINVFRRLGQSAGLEDCKRFFPALEEEAFFPAFAQAASRAERALLMPAAPVHVSRAERAIVFVLPQDRCDLFLVFAEAARRARRGGGWGAIFLTTAGASRANALWLFRDFVRDLPSFAASLLTIAKPWQAFALLPDVLAVVGATRFAFLGDGVFLKESGWVAALHALNYDIAAPILFGDADNTLGANCFAWSSAQLSRWSVRSVDYLGGVYRDNGLGAESPVVLTDVAWCSGRPVARDGLQASVNRILAGNVV
jgi:hypothetical protein